MLISAYLILPIHYFRDLQVPLQPAHPGQRAAAREEAGQVGQAVQEGIQSLGQLGKELGDKSASEWLRRSSEETSPPSPSPRA